MTIRNLDAMFKPASVALLGASGDTRSVGYTIAKNLLSSDFAGDIWLVNPKRDELLGRPVYRKLNRLPAAPDLAVIATPPHSVPKLIDQLGAMGTRAAIIISAGFAEVGPEGRALQQAVLDASRPYLLRLLGPNCLGALVPGIGLNASFAHLSPRAGRLAFVTQSGAIVTGVIDWAHARDIGFSHLVSLGAAADVDFGDMLDYLANDGGTSAIVLYIEAITHARKFMSAARAAARMKPVVVVKGGRFAAGAAAARSHTGAMAGSDAVYDAAFRRAGMVRVHGMDELFGATAILSQFQKLRGDRLAIVTNGGGFGVIAADALIEQGGQLAPLSQQTLDKLDQVLPPTWSHSNPVDIIGDAQGDRYVAALSALLDEPDADMVLLLNCPTAIADSGEIAQTVVASLSGKSNPHLLTAFVGDETVDKARQICINHGIPSFNTPGAAIRGFMHLVDYGRNQRTLMEVPPSIPDTFVPEADQARAIMDRALNDGRDWLTEIEAKRLIASYGIPVPETAVATDPDQVAEIAQRLAVPVAIKVISQQVIHKSDVGGVALNVDPSTAHEVATNIRQRIRQAVPDASIDGFIVEPMMVRPGAFELLLGATEDPQFGPVIMFGQGGIATEVIADTAIALPPLNMLLADEVMRRTRVYRLLEGFRNQPPVELEAVRLALVRMSQMIADLPAIKELDINPLLADRNGVIALDARVRIAEPDPALAANPAQRLAIRPYPKELEQTMRLPDGRRMLLRPIRPEDGPRLRKAFQALTPDQIRARFLMPMRSLSQMMAARFTQLDYDREMAFVLFEDGVPDGTDVHGGVVRISADPDNISAEFAIVIHQELTGLGLGTYLMQRMIDYARERGLQELFGSVLASNRRMLRICEKLGFRQDLIPNEPGLVKVVLSLS